MQHPVGQAQAGGDRGGLRLGRVSAENRQPLFEPAVPTDGAGRRAGIGAGHLRFRRAQFGSQLVEPAGRQHPVDGQHVHVPGPRVLRQVPDGARPADRARGRLNLPGQHLGQRRFPRAVPADQADPVPGGHLE